MSTTLWLTSDGKLIVNGDGQPIVCSTCPCINGNAGTNEAIYGRQLAAGITAEWDSGNPTNPARLIDLTRSYSLDEYKAYVNAIAPNYIDGTYTGGASQPTMLTNTYANVANDVDELFALVMNMLMTKATASLVSTGGAYKRGNGTSSYWDGSLDLAKAEAEADYPKTPWGPSRTTALRAVGFQYNTHYATIELERMSANSGTVATSIRHKFRLFAQSDTANMFGQEYSGQLRNFNKQGQNVPDQNQYGEIYASALYITTASINTGALLADIKPPEWGVSSSTNTEGFELKNYFFAVEWDFSSVCPNCCDTDLNEAIYERQLASGITATWDSGNPTNTARLINLTRCYSLDEYKAYVNVIADKFVDGTYTGGASQPTMLANTYADAAADEAALYMLVLDMLRTKVSATWGNITGKAGIRTGRPPSLWEEARTQAEENWPDSHMLLNFSQPTAFRLTHITTNASAYIYLIRYPAISATVSTSISHSFSLFVKCVNPSYYVFGAQGQTVHTQDTYAKVWDKLNTSNATATSDLLLEDIQPPTWDETYIAFGGGVQGKGLGVAFTDPFFTVSWDFDHA